MSDPQPHKGRVQSVAFTVTCSPGRHAAAGVRQIGPGWLSLVLSMDPGRVVIDVPSVSGGAAVLARFCRELAREASRLAADLDPGQVDTSGSES
ncbi:MAG: hypothetical protein ACRDSR_18680 [Pseudonocardiaceae bacterium]